MSQRASWLVNNTFLVCDGKKLPPANANGSYIRPPMYWFILTNC